MKIVYLDEMTIRNWSGGTTTELAIEPPAARYADHTFLWRLSTAEVKDRKSVFTSLPDYTRLLTIRRGVLRLRHENGSWYELKPGMVTRFDGADRTESEGLVTDFNLMLRKGRCEGSLAVCRLEPEPVFRPIETCFPGWRDLRPGEVRALYVSNGGTLEFRGGINAILHPEELILFDENDAAGHLWLRASGSSQLIAADILTAETAASGK